MPSFDILSEPDSHEVKNAVDQATRELAQRFDFRGTSSEIIRSDDGFDLKANSEDRVKAIWEVLRDKFVKRKLSLKFLEEKAVVPVGGSAYKMSVVLKKGIDKEHAKSLVQVIKDEKSLKVTASIQGDAVRVTGKKKDDLQEVITVLRAKDFDIELSFGNFRE